MSDDAGATWSVVTDGLPTTYARAVAFLDDDVLLSISDGPWAARAAIYRRPLAGGPLERIDDGLGDELVGNVDTRCLATGKGRAALADEAGNVWLSDSGISGWQLLAKELPVGLRRRRRLTETPQAVRGTQLRFRAVTRLPVERS